MILCVFCVDRRPERVFVCVLCVYLGVVVVCGLVFCPFCGVLCVYCVVLGVYTRPRLGCF